MLDAVRLTETLLSFSSKEAGRQVLAGYLLSRSAAQTDYIHCAAKWGDGRPA